MQAKIRGENSLITSPRSATSKPEGDSEVERLKSDLEQMRAALARAQNRHNSMSSNQGVHAIFSLSVCRCCGKVSI